MALSLEELSTDKNIVALQIIKNLDVINTLAEQYAARLDELRLQISSANSMEELHQIVAHVIALEQEVEQFISRETKSEDKEIRSVIKNYCEKNPHLSKITDLFNFSKILDDIVVAKEQLLESALYEKLSGSERSVASEFIENVRALRPVHDDLEAKKAVLRQRLKAAGTPDEIDAIDEEISGLNQTYKLVLGANMHYPQNDQTAGALIEFMESNPHLLAILQSFDIYEDLTDDIFHERGRVYTGPGLD